MSLFYVSVIVVDVAGVEQRFYRSDPDCIAAGKPLVEFELYQSTVLPLEDKGIRYRAVILLHNIFVVVSNFSVFVYLPLDVRS